MPRHAAVRAADRPASTLSVNDLLFVNAYMDNGRNGKQAYLTVHPDVKAGSAEVGAARMLGKVSVQEELALRVRYEVGVTKDWGQSRLLNYEQMALDKQDYAAGAAIVMDAMKLAGFLVEKRADVTPTPTLTEAQLADELRRRGFIPVPGN